VSIGDTLAEARRQSGLTITQVSQQTRIRETIIRSIEQGDFSSCGGDFYARGHIRSIADVVGVDPVPLIREYDEEHGPPGTMRAADIFEPATPIKIHEPRPFGLGKVLIVVLLAVIGFAAYHLVSTHGSHSPSAQTANNLRPVTTPKAQPTVAPTPTATPPPAGPPESVIKLTANQDCWVGLSNTSGTYLYEGIVPAGTTMTWKEKQPVSMVIGNPPGVTLTVNGKTENTNTVQVVTLTIRPSGNNPVTIG
jgi:cytoskeletal protein RodZ